MAKEIVKGSNYEEETREKYDNTIFLDVCDSVDTRLIFIDAGEIGYENTLITMTNGVIKNTWELIRSNTEEKNKLMEINLVNYFDLLDVSEIYGNEEKWRQFCNRVIIYYGIRKIMHNEPIPMSPSYVMVGLGYEGCVMCGVKAVKRCANCGVLYCGEDCQRLDWPFHKNECVPIGEQCQIMRAKPNGMFK